MATAPRFNIRKAAHRVCECGMFFTEEEFRAIKPAFRDLNGSLYEVRDCTHCGLPFSKFVRRDSADDVD